MAAEDTVVVVLEDVHWADDMLLDVVDQLLGQSRGRALMVVCTARPELADRRPSWGAGANMFSVTLERLDDAQTLSLLRHAGPALRPEQAERVAGGAEGNPLFAEHLAALIGDGQGIESLPPSIGLLLTARLEALPDPEREVLGVAAVAGRDFPAAAVAVLVDRPVDADLDHVSRRDLVETIGGEEGRYRFAHALVQEAAYGLLPKARRADLGRPAAARRRNPARIRARHAGARAARPRAPSGVGPCLRPRRRQRSVGRDHGRPFRARAP
jgi:predicted ATPase